MEFKYFETAYTNMWPMANSHKGGQLVTEYTLTSKDRVMAAPNIEYAPELYPVGPSYVHSENDLAVTVMQGSSVYFPGTTTYTDSAIQIQPGMAVVNGYFLELLAPITIDLAKINQELSEQSTEEEPLDLLTGNLAIGLKTYFNSESLVTGSILVEEDVDGHNVYGGIQVVILPVDDFITPTTIRDGVNYGAADKRSYVTADLLLATFNYTNGNITALAANPSAMQAIPAERISNIQQAMADTYITKTGLQPKRLYTFAGKGTDPSTGLDTWCDSTDALMVWDNKTPLLQSVKPESVARFRVDDDKVCLYIPHKQIDGMTDNEGHPQYFSPVWLRIPKANFGTESAGVISKAYTQQVKAVLNRINEFYHLPGGTQKAFIAELNDRADLPPIYQTDNVSIWTPGDYVLVAKDNTILTDLNDTLDLAPPSTLYVVLSPRVKAVTKAESQPTGVQLGIKYLDARLDNAPNVNVDAPDSYNWWGPLSDYRGRKTYDYLTLVYTTYNTDTPVTNTYYYTVSDTYHDKIYSDPVQLTGQIPYATEEMTGGFKNVSTAETDAGYVYLDDEGHLRLLDYALLRTGVLAYQLGEDFTIPTGIDAAEIQANLNEYVNYRVAFANDEQIAKVAAGDALADVININISLPESTETTNIIIQNIDSRFHTAVCVNLSGEANDLTHVYFLNCEKLRIKSTYLGAANGPKIHLIDSCLYYDADIIASLEEISGMTLWYKAYTENDLPLSVDGMTVHGVWESPSDIDVDSLEYWESDAPNDNHIQIALQSLTFASDGAIFGCELLIRNDTTANVELRKSILIDEFTLPQTSGLPYPVNKLVRPIYVTGQFITAYPMQNPLGYVTIDTKFTAKTQTFDANTTTFTPGELTVLIDPVNITCPNTDDHGVQKELDCWSSNTYHAFSGTVNSI